MPAAPHLLESRRHGSWGVHHILPSLLQHVVEDRVSCCCCFNSGTKGCSLVLRPSSEAHGFKEREGGDLKDHVCTFVPVQFIGVPSQSFETGPYHNQGNFTFSVGLPS
ncbi:hypothetical protein M758_9G009100 [Ceratodon purpureus]|nr:hypothetical protein M758_9G009100 [Ceratodon purpureus]